MINTALLAYEGLAERLRPRPPIKVSQWLAENFVLVDGPSKGRLWSPQGAPYLAEIADCLGDDDPCNRVTVRKSQQSGASILALGWILYIAERMPANVLFAAPTLDSLRKMNSGKLQPLIDAWQRRTGRVIIEPLTSRSGTNSTTYEKVYPGGRCYLANANSATDLSSQTIKYGVMDELSKWEDIPGYGNPENLFFGRFTAFRRRGEYKIMEISTPEVDTGDPTGDGHCRIDRCFQESDKRFWHCPCPQCGEYFVHEFKNLRIDEADPAASVYICPANGCVISEVERPRMIRAGRWIAAAPGPGRHPGFHIDSFISLMMSYGEIARDYLKYGKRGEVGRKDFSTFVLGLPHEFKGDAPDHVRLMERREEGLTRGHIPPRGLMLTAAADIQMRGIWLEVVAFAPNRESWTVEARYLDGSTESPDGEAFRQLTLWLDKDWPDAFGRTRKLDALAVDTGYRAPIVYAWTRAHQQVTEAGYDRVLAIKGLDGWGRPAIGTPSLVDIDMEGGKVAKGAKVWGVGSWPLKGAFYADLNKPRGKDGAPDPDGFCHFGHWLDENYFRQITAEHLADVTLRGRTRRVWKQSVPDNHFLDCRVYNLALAEHLGLSILTEAEWSALAKSRGLPPDDSLPLFKGPAASPPPLPSAGEGRGDGGKAAAQEPEDLDALLERLGKSNAGRWR